MLDRSLWIAAGALALVVSLAINCGKDDAAETTPPPTTASSGGSGGTGNTGGSVGMGGSGGTPCPDCTCIDNDGPEVDFIAVDQAAPAPGGGFIRDGLYHLTSVTVYTGSGGATGPTGTKHKHAVYFFGPEVSWVIDQFLGDGDERFQFAYMPDDNGGINFTGLCPGPTSSPYSGFTFVDTTDPPTLTLHATVSAGGLAFVYDLISTPGGDGTGGDAAGN